MKDLRGKAKLNNFKKINMVEIHTHIWLQNLYLLWCTISHSVDKDWLMVAVKIFHSI